ncbi:hypothetical protein FJT64_016961 [Amphibalanus amphitrite]|uniref:Uncharacterized protein n=1 Tax=Amphibalanus amphitrite TaxID=1232801 RepID=A0A6A4WXH4_AMPAM|nr:hypothetical protein FJT64_016961 [Amphibalanus amphitrite]
MGRTEVPFGRLAAMLALLPLLSATVEGSLLGKSLYKRTKEAIDSQDYSAFGKTLHSSRRVPIATYNYEDDTISTARDASSAPVTSLLDRLLKGVSGRSSVKVEESARSTETSPFLSWLSGNGLGSLTGNEATYPVQESAQTIDNVSSTGSLLSLIRKVLDVMRKPETTSASGSGDVYSVSIGDTTESRIGEIIKQLLGRQSSEAEIVVATTGSQSAPVTSSSSPVIEWLETISTSTGGGSPRETTVSGSVSLDELLSELQDSMGFD